MDFRILGPLEVWQDGRSLPLGTPSQRGVLAALLLRPNRRVPVERFVDTLWPEAPPATAVPTVQIYISRLPPLAEITRAHLLDEHTSGRYAFHDLLRAYAGELAHTHDGDRTTAIHRMLDHYLHTAHTAAQLLRSNREPIPLTTPAPGVTPEPLVDNELAWFTAEHPVLLATVELASGTGFDTHTWQLA